MSSISSIYSVLKIPSKHVLYRFITENDKMFTIESSVLDLEIQISSGYYAGSVIHKNNNILVKYSRFYVFEGNDYVIEKLDFSNKASIHFLNHRYNLIKDFLSHEEINGIIIDYNISVIHGHSFIYGNSKERPCAIEDLSEIILSNMVNSENNLTYLNNLAFHVDYVSKKLIG